MFCIPFILAVGIGEFKIVVYVRNNLYRFVHTVMKSMHLSLTFFSFSFFSSHTDMPIFGQCPAQDDFYLVMCSQCSQVVKPQAFQAHYGKS